MVNIDHDVSTSKWVVNMRPNASISWKHAAYACMVIALFMLVIAMGCMLVGAWPVIVYAIAVIIAISAGFELALKRNADYERLTLQDGVIYLETMQGGHLIQREFYAYWTKIVMESMPDGTCQKLALRVHGKEIAIGQHLSEVSKQAVGNLLKERVGLAL